MSRYPISKCISCSVSCCCCYLDKVKALDPDLVVGDLLQTPGMVYNAIICNASKEIHRDNHSDTNNSNKAKESQYFSIKKGGGGVT